MCICTHSDTDSPTSCTLCANDFSNHMWTNLHLHGMFLEPGLQSDVAKDVQAIVVRGWRSTGRVGGHCGGGREGRG